MYKLPVWNTIGEAYRFLWAERSAWLNYALLPVLALTFLGTLITVGTERPFIIDFSPSQLPLPQPDAENAAPLIALPDGVAIALQIINFVVLIAAAIAFPVAWHRRLLLGPGATSTLEILVWKGRHWRYLGRTIAVGIALIFAMILAGLFAGLLFTTIFNVFFQGTTFDPTEDFLVFFALGLVFFITPTYLFVAVIIAPMLPALPAAAVEDYEVTTSSAFRMGKGNFGRMGMVLFFGTFLPYLIISSLGDGVNSAFILSPGERPSIVQTFAVQMFVYLLLYLAIAVGVSALSITYQRLRDNVPLDTEETA
jgi:hypothetical protein